MFTSAPATQGTGTCSFRREYVFATFMTDMSDLVWQFEGFHTVLQSEALTFFLNIVILGNKFQMTITGRDFSHFMRLLSSDICALAE